MTRKALYNIRNGLLDQDAVEAYLKKKKQCDPSFRYFLQKYKSENPMDQQQASRYRLEVLSVFAHDVHVFGENDA